LRTKGDTIIEVQHPFDNHVAARLLDFFDSKTPWQRGLWTPGILLTLQEVLQASEAVAAGVLTTATLDNAASYAVELVGRDSAFADEAQKKVLQTALRTDPKSGGVVFNGLSYRIVRKMVHELGANYLQNWASCLRKKTPGIGPERMARAVSSHLLDSGFSSNYLHRWWSYRVMREKDLLSLAEILEQAHVLVARGPVTFELLVAFESAPVPGNIPANSPWLNNQEVSKWLRRNGFDVRNLRQRGGVKIEMSARDVFSAAENVVEIIDRLIARVSLGTYKKIIPINSVWIAGEKAPVPLRSPRRRVEVHALARENQIYSGDYSGQINAGIELAASLNSELMSAAIAGGWAAVESLMTGPGDKERVLAADRMACITACSFPRAELTALSYKLEEQGGQIAEELHACPSNRDRAAVVARLIRNGGPLFFTENSDSAACTRIEELLRNPSKVLRDIVNHTSVAFRRLYRHRNIVLHWGKIDATGVKSCLRAVAPLVGAGLDRIAHAAFTERLEPLELAARAAIRLGTVGAANGQSPVDLLEPNSQD
jgi:hypothetical protein